LLTGLVGDGVADAVSDNVGGVIGGWRRFADRDGVWRRRRGAEDADDDAAPDPSELPNTMLVAPRTLRTGKFFWALAAHVPCLHYNWILHSAAANELLPLRDYLLPAAIDAARGERPSPLMRDGSRCRGGLRSTACASKCTAPTVSFDARGRQWYAPRAPKWSADS
jgi:hypothetical protein